MLTKISKISVLAERVIKNWRFEPSKISNKSIKKWCKNRSFFDLFFFRFLVDVGPMLGPKILQKSIKNQLKNHFKKCSFFLLILCWFLMDFGSKLGGPREALGRSWRPISSLLGVLIGSGASPLGVFIGSWAQDGPKITPRGLPRPIFEPNMAPRPPPRDPTWPNLAPTRPLLGSILDPTWHQKQP